MAPQIKHTNPDTDRGVTSLRGNQMISAPNYSCDFSSQQW